MKKPIQGPQQMKKNITAQVPLRVAPRLTAQVKNMRVRSKKNSVRGKK
jgi:hypothetical protein